jgi:hypothetical protein
LGERVWGEGFLAGHVAHPNPSPPGERGASGTE